MSALGQISRVKHIFRKDILVTIINSLVFSKLYYCLSVWSNTSASNIRKLQRVRNFAARIVSGTKKFDHARKATEVGSTATVVKNSVLIISHITFRDCRVHIFSDNLSRNSCMCIVSQLMFLCHFLSSSAYESVLINRLLNPVN